MLQCSLPSSASASIASHTKSRGMSISKGSSRASAPFDDTALSDVSNFEDIGLDDTTIAYRGHSDSFSTRSRSGSSHEQPSSASTSNSAPSSAPLAGANMGPVSARQLTAPAHNKRTGASPADPRRRPELLSLRSHIRQANSNANFRNTNTGSLTGMISPGGRRPISPGGRSLPMRTHSQSRSRSPSIRDDPAFILKPKRQSWQPNHSRKSSLELEQECDDDDGGDIPEGLILDNVPLSPRPMNERKQSFRSNSGRSSRGPPSPSPSRSKPRPAGNGTPAVATAHGSLRSPGWRSDSGVDDGSTTSPPNPPNSAPPVPLKARAQSWNLAMSELSPEARMLTAKLEEHQDQTRAERPATWGSSRQSLDTMVQERNKKRNSPLPALPPLRTSDAMIDPLPASKEKEAVLSRTRPPWLPPKDPAEEKRHLKEYQRMMANSLEAEKKREAAQVASKAKRDSNAENTMKLWESDIIPRWPEAIRERKTREMWWGGVAPRSRGVVWTRAIGNELGLSAASFEAASKRAQETEARVADGKGSSEDIRCVEWFTLARRDVETKTWMELKIFQKGGPLHENLVNVLCAYAMYRGDIGYVSGCNTIAALLLLNLPSATEAFISLANVLNRPLPLSFFTLDDVAKSSAYNLVLQSLKHSSRPLYDHLNALSASAAAVETADGIPAPSGPETYLVSIFTAIFTSCLAIDEAARLWDVYVFEGDSLLVRAAVALMVRNEGGLLDCKTLDSVVAVLEGLREPKKVVAEAGAEDNWMKMVRAVGRT